MFEENYAILMERFPKLALEMPSGGKPSGDQESLAPFSLQGVEVLYFYGAGRGEAYLNAADWLHGAKERRLVLLDDLEGIACLLHADAAREILEDSQVVLAHVADIDVLAERFPVSSIEIAALPSKGSFKKLKETLLQKTAFSHALHVDRLHGYQPFHNFIKNLRRLPSSFYANRLAGKFRGIPAVVCGAGPSLKEAIPLLRGLENRALLIAGGSTLAALSSEGVMPHFGMAVDPNLEEYRRLKNSFTFEVPLLYSTRVFPAIFQTMNGPFGYMRTGAGGLLEVWMEEELGLLDLMIGTHLSSDAISVTSMCLGWAEFLGCNPILLSGVDLAYTGKRRYAPGVEEEELDVKETRGAVDRLIRRKDRKGKTIYTAVRWLMESAAFSHFAKMHPETKFLNTTEGGIGFKKIPFCPLEEATSPFADLGFSLRAKVLGEISAAPMPKDAEETIGKKMEELRESLDRIVFHLEVCVEGKAGSAAVAEIEMKEEMAYFYLFYDALSILEKANDENPSAKWNRFLNLAKRYQVVLKEFF